MGSGERGPCFINCKQGTFPVAAVEEFNAKFKGWHFIYQGSENTHMMDGDATCVMYERLFTDAFKLQRAKWDMPTRRGGLICDAATINDCELDGSDIRRRKFSESCNVALPLKKPGGWSDALVSNRVLSKSQWRVARNVCSSRGFRILIKGI